MISIGYDCAREGEDKNVATIALIEGKRYKVLDIDAWSGPDSMVSCGRIVNLNNRYRPDRIVVDADGLGGPIADRLREQGLPIIAFHGSHRCEYKDLSGENGFANMRSYAYWCLRELLDTHNGFEVSLPKNDTLLGDLCAPKWTIRSGGLIQVESKPDMKKRLKRSPDFGDSLAYAFLNVDRSQFEEGFAIYRGDEVAKRLKNELYPTPSQEQREHDLLWGGATKSNFSLMDWDF